jgi:hypothetical protein
MTYVADLDPESPTRAAQEAHVAWADETMPGWEAREQAPEDRRLVAEQDVAERRRVAHAPLPVGLGAHPSPTRRARLTGRPPKGGFFHPPLPPWG